MLSTYNRTLVTSKQSIWQSYLSYLLYFYEIGHCNDTISLMEKISSLLGDDIVYSTRVLHKACWLPCLYVVCMSNYKFTHLPFDFSI